MPLCGFFSLFLFLLTNKHADELLGDKNWAALFAIGSAYYAVGFLMIWRDPLLLATSFLASTLCTCGMVMATMAIANWTDIDELLPSLAIAMTIIGIAVTRDTLFQASMTAAGLCLFVLYLGAIQPQLSNFWISLSLPFGCLLLFKSPEDRDLKPAASLLMAATVVAQTDPHVLGDPLFPDMDDFEAVLVRTITTATALLLLLPPLPGRAAKIAFALLAIPFGLILPVWGLTGMTLLALGRRLHRPAAIWAGGGLFAAALAVLFVRQDTDGWIKCTLIGLMLLSGIAARIWLDPVQQPETQETDQNGISSSRSAE